jgi:putative ABC transport system permease protein
MLTDELRQDVRQAARGLARMRGVALTAILTLGLGIGATTTMFSVVYAALLRPPPFADPDRLVMLFVTRTTPQEGLVRLRWSVPVSSEIAGAVTSYEAIATVTGTSIAVGSEPAAGAGQPPEQIDGEMVSAEYFTVVRASPAVGRLFRADEDTAAGAHPLAMVSDRLWRRRYHADPSFVGRTIRVNDVALTVVGIMPAGFLGVTGKADVWMPRTMAPVLTYSEYLVSPQHFVSVIARLRPGVDVARANAELAAVGGRFADEGGPSDAQWSATALTVNQARVDPTLRRSVLVLLAAAICVLLIACVNVAGLLLARARTRRREIAIRLAIGSNRRRLVQQLLTEGLLLAALAGVCGALLAVWGVRFFASASPGIIASFGNNYAAVASFAAPALDVRVLLFASATTIGTTLLFALVPAVDASRTNLVSALKEDDRGGGRGRALAALVVSEVALAVLLLAGAGLLVQTFAHMHNVRGGFQTERVLTYWIRPPNSRYAPADGPAVLERMLTRIEQVPGVESAAVNRATPFMGGSRSQIFFPGRPLDRANAPGIGRHYVSAGYFRTLGIPLRAGRLLTPADRAGTAPVAVVNETGARRFWSGENPIGKRVWFGTTTGTAFTNPDRPVEIVGVVGDVKYDAPGQPMAADFYTSYLQFAYPDTIMIVKTRGPSAALVPALRAAVAAVDAAVPIYDVMTLDERISGALSRPRFNATIVGAFAAAALLLAALGVYGMLSYSVSSRMREMGVRVALGANAGRVVRLVLGEGLKLAAVGAALGIAAALAGTRLMQGLLVGVQPSDLRVLATGAAVMLAAAAGAAWLPARRASAVDPIVVLRES